MWGDVRTFSQNISNGNASRKIAANAGPTRGPPRPHGPQGIATIAVIADSSHSVIVVSGLPRSGTSMMMQMLAAGGLDIMTDQVRAADDDNLAGYYELEAVKRTREEASWLQDAPGKAVKVIYRLLEYLPDDYHYQVLFMQRPLEEVIASQQLMLQRRGAEARDRHPRSVAIHFRQ